jgi:hypothetical protein
MENVLEGGNKHGELRNGDGQVGITSVLVNDIIHLLCKWQKIQGSTKGYIKTLPRKLKTKHSYIWLKDACNSSSFLLIREQLKNYFNSFDP